MKNKKIHFIGIGGISMSALATYLHLQGYSVQGSDIAQNNETIKLNNLGINTFVGHNAVNLQNVDVCVYSGAIDKSNVELAYALNHSIPTLERSELLGIIAKDFTNTIAVAGTHGKTTTTAMLAQIFIDANLSPTVHIGGDFDYIKGNFLYSKKKYFITEACEYRRSFLALHPQYSIINNVELDHTDCYKDITNMYDAFYKFVEQTQNAVFINYNDPFYKLIKNNDKVISYGLSSKADYCATNLRQNKNKYTFDILHCGEYIGTIKLNIAGKYNAVNALASVSVSHYLGIPIQTIKQSLYNFKNVDRRFEFIKKLNNSDIYRDYAHHPTEIKNLLNNIKHLKYDKIICFFQPHTYSRTKGLFNEFLTSFDSCDKLYLLPTYPAREFPIEGGDSKDLYNELKKYKKEVHYIQDIKEVKQLLNENSIQHNIILLVGAGDIGNIDI